MIVHRKTTEGGYAIVGDLHGHAELLKRATEIVDPTMVQFVVQDILDKGPEVRGCLMFAKDIGAMALADNHNWVCGNALLYEETGAYGWLRSWYTSIEKDTLSSFGIKRSGNAARDATSLRARLEEDGLLHFVLDTSLYIEPEDDGFIAIHAGILPISWALQKKELDKFAVPTERWKVTPKQVFDERDFTYSTSNRVSADVTEKKVITGHNHLSLTPEERVTGEGRRIRLASKLYAGEPLYIYLTQTSEIIEVPQHTSTHY